MWDNLYEELKAKINDPVMVRTWLCDLQSLGGGCGTCPARKWCGRGHNGFEELLKKDGTVFEAETFDPESAALNHEIEDRRMDYGI